MISVKKWWLISLKGLIFIFLGMYIFKFPVSGMLGLIIYGGISLFQELLLPYLPLAPGGKTQAGVGN